MREHGGDLVRASREYGISTERWLDLSTGINPHGYPVPPVPAQAWLRLPSDDAPLRRAAAEYYGTDSLLPVAGTQAAIQALPRLRPHSRVLLATLTYSEYAHAWRRHGHDVRTAEPGDFGTRLSQTDVLIVCNPNNPTGERIAPQRLLEWHAELSSRGGWLIVDEAYIDVTPQASVASVANRAGFIVLRSLGKFFGLAGARVGFVFSERAIRDALQSELGPWTVSGPSLFAACDALRDTSWQAKTRLALMTSANRLRGLLTNAEATDAFGTPLFLWWRDTRALALHHALARHAILTRVFRDSHPAGIRFGLPGAEGEWVKLNQALSSWKDMSCV